MNQFEELIQNLNLTEEEIKLFHEKNIVSPRVEKITKEFFKEDDTFEKSGAPHTSTALINHLAGVGRIVTVTAIINWFNDRVRRDVQRLGPPESNQRAAQMISPQWSMVIAFFALRSGIGGVEMNGEVALEQVAGQLIPAAVTYAICNYLDANPDVSSTDLFQRFIYGAGILTLAAGGAIATSMLADNIGGGPTGLILAAFLALAIGGTTIERHRVTVNGERRDVSPRTGGVIADVMDTERDRREREARENASTPGNFQPPPIPRQSGRLTPRGIRHRRSTTPRRRREYVKNNIKF